MFDLKNFDTIIFDFGGVILDIDTQKMMDAFVTMFGVEHVEKIQKSGILEQIEKGEITSRQLLDGVKKQTQVDFNEQDFYAAWNAILLDYKPERIKKIQELKKTHQLFLLSNTNEIHYHFFSEKLQNEYGLKFTDLFVKPYTSYEMGLLKPDKRIYKQVINEQQLIPERTLFIEDTEINTKAAEELGIKTLLIPRNGTFYDFLA